ncbi:hypothetical protein ACFFX0_23680 [Citricoccus parietis]|uniref:Uncharacterized protein n=1 Tax=Citricoccus parietis TaxID=592307 RepID=A0ABV5G511_9MICC
MKASGSAPTGSVVREVNRPGREVWKFWGMVASSLPSGPDARRGRPQRQLPPMLLRWRFSRGLRCPRSHRR